MERLSLDVVNQLSPEAEAAPGKGSSLLWYRRGLVVKDFQHPTSEGAARIAEALYAGLVH